MFFIQKEYVKYLLSSTNEHGVHSPFVFNFVTNCIYSSSSNEQKVRFRDYNLSLVNDSDEIEVLDFGAGSRVFKDSKRKISRIAEVAGIKKKYGLLLMRMMSYFDVKESLEVCTSLGTASFCISNENSDLQLSTLEGCPNTLNAAKQHLKSFDLNNIDYICGEFEETLNKVIEDRLFDFIYFDGSHTKEATLNYFETCLKTKHNDSIFIFDDIHWSQGMLEAWGKIKSHPDVTVTVDLFQWGIVFFRKEQRKEHFKIRF